MRRIATISLISLTVSLGCSETPPSETSSTAPSAQQTASVANPPAAKNAAMPGFQPQRPDQNYADPRQTVTDFLVAVKAGDHNVATTLLSTAAQQEAWKNGLAITSEGFPDASFKISEAEILEGNQEAHVMTVWDNVREFGGQNEFECVWLLRNESHGWCVYGMAMRLEVEPPQPLVFNFENQPEMQRRQAWAAEQMELYQQAKLQQAQAQAMAQQMGTHGPAAPGATRPQPGQQQFQQAPAQQIPGRQATLPSSTPR